ncbi:MAG: thiamine ABC transporter substrate-binding protein, partial [Microthrixaceae bacterium]
MRCRFSRFLSFSGCAAIAVVATIAAACGPGDPAPSDSVTLLTHDSFAISPETFDSFTEETG